MITRQTLPQELCTLTFRVVVTKDRAKDLEMLLGEHVWGGDVPLYSLNGQTLYNVQPLPPVDEKELDEMGNLFFDTNYTP